LAFATVAGAIADAELKGLLRRVEPGGWRVTELGQRFLNDLQALFLPADQALGGQSGVTSAA